MAAFNQLYWQVNGTTTTTHLILIILQNKGVVMPILYIQIASTEIKLLYEVTEKRERKHPNLSDTKVRVFASWKNHYPKKTIIK